MNKPVNLGLSVLELSKIFIFSFITYIKTNYIYIGIAEVVETRFDTSNYELDRPLPKGKNKKIFGLMKNELGGTTMTRFVGLRSKVYSYLMDDGSEDKKTIKYKTQ